METKTNCKCCSATAGFLALSSALSCGLRTSACTALRMYTLLRPHSLTFSDLAFSSSACKDATCSSSSVFLFVRSALPFSSRVARTYMNKNKTGSWVVKQKTNGPRLLPSDAGELASPSSSCHARLAFVPFVCVGTQRTSLCCFFWVAPWLRSKAQILRANDTGACRCDCDKERVW